jgi:cytosine/adenosine deaminase-related metal-dependent hydrolase
MILRAHTVLPIARPPIKNGAVQIVDRRIARVGRWKEFSATDPADIVDLGDSILLPGLVNAHCHLDYTAMAGTLPPQKSFIDWLKFMLAAKAEWNYSEYAASWLEGAHMLLRSGTTTVADFEAVPELLPEVWSSTPLRVISFLELTGVRSRRDPRAVLQEATERADSLPPGNSRAALAPHAPYSTVPELLRLSAEFCLSRRWPLSIHLAESKQEFEMFSRARGEMFKWLRRNERDMRDCGRGSPVRHLDRCGVLGAHLLAVHVNYLAKNDAALLGRRNVSVVHCPRSHSYFRHHEFPLARLTKAKVNVCLGTDSLATVSRPRRQTIELSMFEEMRSFAAAHPRIPAKTILEMSTIRGARALGLAGSAGELSAGAFADLITIPFIGKLAEANDAVVQHRGNVSASMIDGQWAIAPADL